MTSLPPTRGVERRADRADAVSMEQNSPELALVDPALRAGLQAELTRPTDCLAPRVRALADERPVQSAANVADAAPPIAVVAPAVGDVPLAPFLDPPATRVVPTPRASPRLTPPAREAPAVFVGTAANRDQHRVAAHLVVAGILVSAPFVGPVMIDLLGRV